MKIRVNQGCSICFGGVWFDQGRELDVPNPSEYGDQVTVIEAAPAAESSKKKTGSKSEQENQTEQNTEGA